MILDESVCKGKLVQALAQEHTVVGYDRQVVSQDQFVGFDDSQDTLLVYDPEVTGHYWPIW